MRELRAVGVEAEAYDFDRNLLHTLEQHKVVAAVPALHGHFGEDGEIQTLLELIDLPYVGSRSRACRVAHDKGTARELLRRAGIAVPESVGLSAQTFRDIGASALMEHVMHRLGERVVVKPTRCGSALGVTGVDGLAALPSALVTAYAYGDDALVERFYDGTDVSVVCIETDEGVEALTPVAVEYEKGHEFDFDARYTAEFVSFSRPDLPEELIEDLGRTACEAHQVLGPAPPLALRLHRLAPTAPTCSSRPPITPGTTETSVMPFACTLSGTSLGQVVLDLVRRTLP